MAVAVATVIRLELGGCVDESCSNFGWPLWRQLDGGSYDLCSVLPMPARLSDWRAAHRTARKRADRCARLGYRFAEIHRELFEQDIHGINVSLAERQGRPMSRSYHECKLFAPLDAYPCERHRVRTFGVLERDRLVAYLWLYRAGELALVSSILGHGAHLANDVMYLLVQGAIEAEIDQGGYLVYNRHDSGQDGLRYFKERLGFAETPVRWLA